jgi:hypothetical protein
MNKKERLRDIPYVYFEKYLNINELKVSNKDRILYKQRLVLINMTAASSLKPSSWDWLMFWMMAPI